LKIDARGPFERSAFLWITLPILLGVLLAAGLLLGAAVSGDGDRLGSLAQLAVIMLGAILLTVGLSVMAFCVVAAYGINRMIDYLPPRTARIRRMTRQLAAGTRQTCDLLVAPVIYLARIRALGAGFAEGVRDRLGERMDRHG
jgi:hypothetical protein